MFNAGSSCKPASNIWAFRIHPIDSLQVHEVFWAQTGGNIFLRIELPTSHVRKCHP